MSTTTKEREHESSTVKSAAILVGGLRPAFREKFKDWCTIRGRSMNATIVRLMERVLDGSIKLNGDNEDVESN